MARRFAGEEVFSAMAPSAVRSPVETGRIAGLFLKIFGQAQRKLAQSGTGGFQEARQFAVK
jgi:hypothetical protein